MNLGYVGEGTERQHRRGLLYSIVNRELLKVGEQEMDMTGQVVGALLVVVNRRRGCSHGRLWTLI